jgi:bifunctional non-homologous end joining protein LigD
MALDTAEDIVAAVQMGTIEFHIWGSSADALEKPDRLVFDLDPDPSVGFDAVVRAAVELRAVLDSVGLRSLAMVTGGKGVHVVAPLQRKAEWDMVKTFAKSLSVKLAEAAPERYTATMSKAKRKGRIFIDWLRNERGSTAIAPFSVRARPGAPVALPVTWEELRTLKAANTFSLDAALARSKEPDPWREADGWRQSVTKAMLDAVTA